MFAGFSLILETIAILCALIGFGIFTIVRHFTRKSYYRCMHHHHKAWRWNYKRNRMLRKKKIMHVPISIGLSIIFLYILFIFFISCYFMVDVSPMSRFIGLRKKRHRNVKNRTRRRCYDQRDCVTSKTQPWGAAYNGVVDTSCRWVFFSTYGKRKKCLMINISSLFDHISFSLCIIAYVRYHSRSDLHLKVSWYDKNHQNNSFVC